MSLITLSTSRASSSEQEKSGFSWIRRFERSTEALPRHTVLWLAIVLFLLPAATEAALSHVPGAQNGQQSAKQVEKRRPTVKRVRTFAITRKQLLTPPVSSLIRAPEPLGNIPPITSTPEVHRRPGKVYVTTEGLALGDYFFSPRVVFGTDNRYDDANVRERAMREDMDALQARQHGELREDPLSKLIRNRQQGALNPSEPGFRLASTVHELLQLTLHMPINSLHPEYIQDRPTRLVVTSPSPSPQTLKRPVHLSLPPP